MSWRWLWGDYVDEAYGLSREKRREIALLAQRKYTRGRTLVVFTLLVVMPPVVVAFSLLPIVLSMLGYAGRNMPFFVGMTVIVVAFWPWSAWAYTGLYGKPFRRAMRDLGYDVCVNCGYRMEGLGADAKCPECGQPREVTSPS